MEGFCNVIISDIKSAKDETELIKVIGNSLHELRKERNSFNEGAYITNMIAALRAMNADNTSTDSFNNIQLAIAIFRQLHGETRQRIF